MRGGVVRFSVRDTCRLCGGGLEKVLDLGWTPLANALLDDYAKLNAEHPSIINGEKTFPLYLSRCLSCGHVQLPVVVDPKLLFPADYPYASATSPVFRAHLDQFAVDVWPPGFEPLRGSRVVEIGSNDGYLLRRFQEQGMYAIGVDPAVFAKAPLTIHDLFNFELACSLRGAWGTADRIVALNVFAHSDDLSGIAHGVKTLLAPDGEFVFEVAHLPRMLAGGYFDCIYHEHLAFHHLEPLMPFFAARGLQVTDVRAVDTQGGSMRVTVKHAGTQGWTGSTVRVAAWLEAERKSCSREAVERFAQRVGAFRAEFSMHIRQLMVQGKKIAAFGCPAKATTLLHACGLHGTDIGYIVEENPLKQGKFSPGKHIPIVAPGHLDAHPVDVMLCLAWNFATDIKKRYAHWPVEWVVPFA